MRLSWKMDQMKQSIQLAEELKREQGYFECEVSFDGEADLVLHKKFCTKNPGHQKFISVNDFSIDKLPIRYRDSLIVDLIKVMSELTVKVTVSNTSPARPARFPDSQTPYPFHKCRGGDKFSRTGSGKCVDFYKKFEENNEGCPCRLCRESGKPVKTWGAVIVHTATHVAFDDLEAKHTRCVIAYDDELNMSVNLEAVGVVGGRADIAGDRCLLRCVTHNLGLVDALWKTARVYRELHKQVRDKYRTLNDSQDRSRLVIVVSHPHGRTKQITLGECTGITKGDVYASTVQFTYTASTCPGSSGAPVIVVGRGNEWWTHTHSGANSKGNISSTIYIEESN